MNATIKYVCDLCDTCYDNIDEANKCCQKPNVDVLKVGILTMRDTGDGYVSFIQNADEYGKENRVMFLTHEVMEEFAHDWLTYKGYCVCNG